MRNTHSDAATALVLHESSSNEILKTCRISKCRQIFETVDEREQHEKEFKHFRCQPCGIGFFKALELSKHRREDMCKGSLILSTSLSQLIGLFFLELICDKCGMTFFNDEPLKRYKKAVRHKASCYNERKFICDECGEKFNSNIQVNSALRCVW